MTEDARFEDADRGPLRLRALDADDLQVISSLTQDAVFPATEMTWDRRHRRFGLLLNRFRWEDLPDAQRRGREVERVQTVLSIEDATAVASQGVNRADADTILSLLSIEYAPHDDGRGEVLLTLAGDGAIRVRVDCLSLSLQDVTRPYVSLSGKMPQHDV